MRLMRAAVGSVIAPTILTVNAAGVLAKAAHAEQAEPWEHSLECIAAPVRDAPFSAEAVTAWYPPPHSGRTELRSTARYYRDRAGRVRVEFVGGMTPERVMITLDADSRVAYLLDTVARTAMRISRGSLASIAGDGCHDHLLVLPLSKNRVISFGAHPIDKEPLGERSMAGVPVTGTRFTMKLPVTATGLALEDRWVSPELKLVIYSRREDADVGVVEHQLGKISRTEPPPDLFEVPTNYVEDGVPCITWENPYASKPIRTGCGDRR